jgi:hypothetical protein
VILMRGGGGSKIGRDQVHELTAAFREAAGTRDPGVPAVAITPPDTPFSSGTPGPLASPTP